MPMPENEAERLKALKEYNILDTEFEEEFDRITELASLICEVPISLVSLIDENRQWFKSRLGLDAAQTARKISFCQFTIGNLEMFEVEDAILDERFKKNPLVTGQPGIRFYAGYPLIDPNGHALGTLCVIDTKPNKLNENQQRALIMLANEIVSQIIARKERAELKIAKEVVKNAEQLKASFLGNISHEVRTPLQGILGITELLENRDIDESKKLEYLKLIRRRTLELQDIIDSLLDLASLEAGGLKPVPKTFDLHDFFVEIIQPLAIEKQLAARHLKLFFENEVRQKSFVTVDPKHLKRVIECLVLNALKFTPYGFVKIKAHEEANQFRISISDSGQGIDPDHLEKILLPFRQDKEGFNRSTGGVGIGLSITQKMIAMWNGRLEIVSLPGKGSTFSLLIPI